MIKSDKKLIIIRGQLVGHMAVFHPGIPIEIKFNPTEYSLEKRNSFSEATIPGLESPLLQFSSGDSRTLSFELLIDTYTYDNGVDIRPLYIAKLESLMEVEIKHLDVGSVVKVAFVLYLVVGIVAGVVYLIVTLILGGFLDYGYGPHQAWMGRTIATGLGC